MWYKGVVKSVQELEMKWPVYLTRKFVSTGNENILSRKTLYTTAYMTKPYMTLINWTDTDKVHVQCPLLTIEVMYQTAVS